MGGDLFFDRVPPQNLEAEQAVIGAVLLQDEALITAMERVNTEDFYDKAHQMIFEAMVQLGEESQPIDLVTLTSRLQDKGELEDIGGVSYLAKLAHAVPTAANVEYYAQIIEEKAMLRRLIRTATQIVSEGYTGGEDVADMLSDAERRILEISNRRSGSGFIAIRDVLMEVFDKVELLHQNKDKGGMSGIPTGFVDLDHMTNGFQRNDLTIVAALLQASQQKTEKTCTPIYQAA